MLGALAKKAHPHLIDPNVELGDRFVEMVVAMRDALVGPSAARTVGLVYPTELTEDLSLVRLYKRWLEARGLDVALGSPYNLRRAEGEASVRVFEEPVGLLVRHYKTDWWSERASAWDDEVVLDKAPLATALHAALSAQAEAGTAIVNPFGAVVAQNKRTMALMWEHIHRFSIRAQDVIRELVPVTMRLEAAHPEMLRARREDWVLKSDYGAEGEEVVIGALVTEAVWTESLAHARRGRWVAQRFFEAEKDDRGPHHEPRSVRDGRRARRALRAARRARHRRAGAQRAGAARCAGSCCDRAGLGRIQAWRATGAPRRARTRGRRRRPRARSSGRTGRAGRRGSPCR